MGFSFPHQYYESTGLMESGDFLFSLINADEVNIDEWEYLGLQLLLLITVQNIFSSRQICLWSMSCVHSFLLRAHKWFLLSLLVSGRKICRFSSGGEDPNVSCLPEIDSSERLMHVSRCLPLSVPFSLVLKTHMEDQLNRLQSIKIHPVHQR